MHRMACVDLPAFPLQLLLHRHPEWKSHPVAVVDRDRPQGRILWVNEKARRARILPGMRYAGALSLSGALRAAEVPSCDVARSVQSTVGQLRKFTPDVEAAQEEPGMVWRGPGVFWLNASGLDRLYHSLSEWARCIRFALKWREFVEATVVVGFSKFGTWAVAQASRGIAVFQDQVEERAAVYRVPLERLPLAPSARDTLCKLGVQTVGEFAQLPAEGIEKRFGENAWHLHRQARGERPVPLAPQPPKEPFQRSIHLDYAVVDGSRLMDVILHMMQPLEEVLAHGDQSIAEIQLDLRFERGDYQLERVRPASPTADLRQLAELIRLRLASISLPDGVTDVTLTAEGTRVAYTQLELFAYRPPRDPGAAERALARIRAEFGESAVVCARLREAHLPEARFFWEPITGVRRADPCQVEAGALVRRIFHRPLRLPARPRHEPDGWMLHGLEQGPVVRVVGPYIVSGGWWRRPVHREYHFAETRKGELLWVYYDRFRRRWFIQGRVE